MSVYSKGHNPENTVKRNTFDKSRANNLTFDSGMIVPILCEEVLAGDTWTFDVTHALRFMPTYFPNQNRIRCDVHGFYVRSRNIYDRYKQFATGNLPSDALGMPSLGFGIDRTAMFKDGGLADYFNIPTHYFGLAQTDDDDTTIFLRDSTGVPDVSHTVTSQFMSDHFTPYFPFSGVSFSLLSPGETLKPSSANTFLGSSGDYVRFLNLGSFSPNRTAAGWTISVDYSAILDLNSVLTTLLESSNIEDVVILPVLRNSGSPAGSRTFSSLAPAESVKSPFTSKYLVEWTFQPAAFSGSQADSNQIGFLICPVCPPGGAPWTGFSSVRDYYIEGHPLYDYDFNIADAGFGINPYNPSNNPSQPLNVLPFRAYESIYNAFFRDDRNNPLTINNQPVYDVYCPSVAGGVDNTVDYGIRYRNWEQDQFTTALPSPQQGPAPLVGITNGTAYVSDPDTGQTYMAKMSESSDGKSLDVSFTEVNQDTTIKPDAIARSLVSVATSGISINDFRNVNALQRYLELNMMRGRKYKDIIEARWGVNISYAELDMPEFIGGTSSYIQSYQVNQTAPAEDSVLGSYAGQMSTIGNFKNKIRHYCDEPGYIILTISVVPVPVYTQSLPPMFTRFDQLDFYNPEFGHIGYQAIPNKIVAPLQYGSTSKTQFESTFGYQRPWWDYMSATDEAHGDMRGSLRDFLMYRRFAGLPTLSKDFLVVDPASINNIYSVQTDADGNEIHKIIGQVFIDAKAKRPIPLYSTPRLE